MNGVNPSSSSFEDELNGHRNNAPQCSNSDDLRTVDVNYSHILQELHQSEENMKGGYSMACDSTVTNCQVGLPDWDNIWRYSTIEEEEELKRERQRDRCTSQRILHTTIPKPFKISNYMDQKKKTRSQLILEVTERAYF